MSGFDLVDYHMPITNGIMSENFFKLYFHNAVKKAILTDKELDLKERIYEWHEVEALGDQTFNSPSSDVFFKLYGDLIEGEEELMAVISLGVLNEEVFSVIGDDYTDITLYVVNGTPEAGDFGSWIKADVTRVDHDLNTIPSKKYTSTVNISTSNLKLSEKELYTNTFELKIKLALIQLLETIGVLPFIF